MTFHLRTNTLLAKHPHMMLEQRVGLRAPVALEDDVQWHDLGADFTAVTFEQLCAWEKLARYHQVLSTSETLAFMRCIIALQKSRKGSMAKGDAMDCLSFVRNALMTAITFKDEEASSHYQIAFNVMLKYQKPLRPTGPLA